MVEKWYRGHEGSKRATDNFGIIWLADDPDYAQLYANVVINEDETNKAEFINEYDAAKVSTTISGIKELISEHKDLEEGQFTFAIETDNAPLPSETEVTNDESGYFQFDSISVFRFIKSF